MNKPQNVPIKGIFSRIIAIINNNFDSLYQHLLLYYDTYIKQTKFAGYFGTLQELQTAVTDANSGCYAYVPDPSDSTMWIVYQWGTNGWEATTQRIPAGNVTIHQDNTNITEGGSSVLQEDLRISNTVGYLSPGAANAEFGRTDYTIPKGTSLEKIIRLMFDTYKGPKVTVTGGKAVECGALMSEGALSITCELNDTKNIYNAVIKKNNVVMETITKDDLDNKKDAQGNLIFGGAMANKKYTFSYPLSRANSADAKYSVPTGAATGSVTYSVTVNFIKNDDSNDEDSGDTKFTVHHYYYANFIVEQTDVSQAHPFSDDALAGYISSSTQQLASNVVSGTFKRSGGYKTMVFIFPRISTNGGVTWAKAKQGTNPEADMLTLDYVTGSFTTSNRYGHAQTYDWYVFSAKLGYGDNVDFIWSATLK